MAVAFTALAAALILLVTLWQAALLHRAEPARRAQRDSLVANRAQALALTPRPTDPFNRLVGVLRRRRWFRRGLSGVSGLAFLLAVVLIGFPFYTNLLQDRIQERLSNQLVNPDLRQAYLERRVAEGDSLTRIQIPAIDVDVVVVEGTGEQALRAGAGHYRSTPLPCENGNVAIAGHRTTYGRPFHNMDLLKVGDQITLTTPIGTCTYTVNAAPQGRDAFDDKDSSFVVDPTDVGVVANSSKPMLTLTTCHPKGSAAERLIIQADLAPASSTSTPAPGGT
ncbi:MAG: class E sortase [Acidimicrobiales bacterium]